MSLFCALFSGGTKVCSIHGGLGVAVVACICTYAYFVAPLIQYVRAADGTAHPGAEHAFRSSVISDVLSAVGRAVTEATDACTRVFIPPPGIVREVVVLDHVLRMSTGGFLEGGMHAERLQTVVHTSVVVQGEQPLLRSVQEDLTPSAPAGIASTRCLGGLVYTDEACGRKKATKTTSRHLMNTSPSRCFRHFSQSALQLVVLAPCRICQSTYRFGPGARHVISYDPCSLLPGASVFAGSDRMR